MPVTAPSGSTVAMAVLLLLHTPSGVVSDNNDDKPEQVIAVPVMALTVGTGLTVTAKVAVAVPQILLMPYMMTAAPGATPVTLPEASTDAIVASLLLHVPRAVVSPNAHVAPAHIADVPVMAVTAAKGLTVITEVTELLQPNVLPTR